MVQPDYPKPRDSNEGAFDRLAELRQEALGEHNVAQELAGTVWYGLDPPARAQLMERFTNRSRASARWQQRDKETP